MIELLAFVNEPSNAIDRLLWTVGGVVIVGVVLWIVGNIGCAVKSVKAGGGTPDSNDIWSTGFIIVMVVLAIAGIIRYVIL